MSATIIPFPSWAAEQVAEEAATREIIELREIDEGAGTRAILDLCAQYRRENGLPAADPPIVIAAPEAGRVVSLDARRSAANEQSSWTEALLEMAAQARKRCAYAHAQAARLRARLGINDAD